MNLLEHTQEICQKNLIKPARSKGQNFLINESVYDEMVAAAEIQPDDIVLEVGPGLGFLTRKLAAKAKQVIAVELDDKLAALLATELKREGIENVEVVNENILDSIFNFQFSTLPTGRQVFNKLSSNEFSKVKVVANLPYNITSVFLRKVLTGEKKPVSLTLMLQKEVAERIVASRPKMSLLAVSVQLYAKAEIVTVVPKNDFWPMPEVDSAIIKLRMKNEELRIKKVDEKKFWQLVKFGFSSKRKMLKNNLSAGFQISQAEAGEILKKAGFNEKIRAQELSVEDWEKLGFRF